MDIQAIEKWLIEKATAYYEGRRLVSDAEFDAVVSKLRALSPNHPYLITPGWGYAPQYGVKHEVQIKADIVRCVDYEDFVSRFDDSVRYTIIPKIDGITIVIYCLNYKLEKILTRGNGIVGRQVAVNPAWERQLTEICRLLDSFGGEGAIICSACLPSEKEFGWARDTAAEMMFSDGGNSDYMRFFPHSLLIEKNEEDLTRFIDNGFIEITKVPTKDEVKSILEKFQSQGYDCDGVVLSQKSIRYVHYC